MHPIQAEQLVKIAIEERQAAAARRRALLPPERRRWRRGPRGAVAGLAQLLRTGAKPAPSPGRRRVADTETAGSDQHRGELAQQPPMEAGAVPVSTRGQLSLPHAARQRWGLERGGEVRYVDLGDALLFVPRRAGERDEQQLVGSASSSGDALATQ